MEMPDRHNDYMSKIVCRSHKRDMALGTLKLSPWKSLTRLLSICRCCWKTAVVVDGINMQTESFRGHTVSEILYKTGFVFEEEDHISIVMTTNHDYEFTLKYQCGVEYPVKTQLRSPVKGSFLAKGRYPELRDSQKDFSE